MTGESQDSKNSKKLIPWREKSWDATGKEERRVEDRAARESRMRVLVQKYQMGNERALNEILESHEGMIQRAARTRAWGGESVEDLAQVGRIGLIKATRRYAPDESDTNSSFAAYARAMIEGEISHHMRDHASSVKLPRWARSQKVRVDEARAVLLNRNGVEPTRKELAEEANLTEDGIDELDRLLILASSAPGGGDEALLAIEADTSALHSARQESFTLPIEDRIRLERALRALPEAQRKVVYLLFYREYTYAEVASTVGYSARHVARLAARGIETMKTSMQAGSDPSTSYKDDNNTDESNK